MKKYLYLILLFTFITYVSNTQKVYGNSYITNAGFEENGNWSTMNSNITFSYVNDQFYEGQRSALVHNSSSTVAGIEQTITTISSNQQYEINAFVRITQPLPSKVLIRIAWYASSDGSGSQISIQDSNIITSTSEWSKLELFPVSPSTARSAKLRLITASGAAYFDNVDMKLYTASPTQPISSPTISLSPTITPTFSQISPTLTNTPTPSYAPDYENIVISEVMVDPIDGNEWVEIENKNNIRVEILKWYIDDEENTGGTPKEFSASIEAGQLAIIDLSSSMFNNAGDSVRLLNNGKDLKDSFEYSSSEKGKSIGRIGEDYCLQEPSKSLANNPCINQQNITPTVKLTATTSSNSKSSSTSSSSKTKENTNTKSKTLLSSERFEDNNSDESDPPLYFQLSTEVELPNENNNQNIHGITHSYNNQSSSHPLLKILTLLACSFTTLAITSILIKMQKSLTLYYSWAKLSK